MNIIVISPNGSAAQDYRGCGKAWAAISNGEVVAIRYMDMGTANRRDMSFAEHRDASRAELSSLGEVVSGTCSCWEFIRN